MFEPIFVITLGKVSSGMGASTFFPFQGPGDDHLAETKEMICLNGGQ
jgi:hypothetical protein